MSLIEANEVSSVSAEALEISDVTGAGNTVIGAMAVLVACGIYHVRRQCFMQIGLVGLLSQNLAQPQ